MIEALAHRARERDESLMVVTSDGARATRCAGKCHRTLIESFIDDLRQAGSDTAEVGRAHHARHSRTGSIPPSVTSSRGGLAANAPDRQGADRSTVRHFAHVTLTTH